MSRQDKNKNQTAPAAQATEIATAYEVQSAVPAESPPESVPSQAAIVPAASVEITPTVPEETPDPSLAFDIFAENAQKALIVQFPQDARYLRQCFHPVGEEEMYGVLETLPAPMQAAFRETLEKMDPVKLGDHTRKRQGFNPFEIRIYHGTGNDELRSKLTPVGGLYSTDGRILATGDAEQSEMLKVPEKLTGWLVGIYDVNTLWPPRAEDGKPEGEDGAHKSRAPICRSMDREVGSKYGSCATCEERPWKDNEPNKDGCRSETLAFFVLPDFSGVYRMLFTGTNSKAAKTIRKIKDAGWPNLWKHPFVLATRKEVGKEDATRRWYVIEPDANRKITPTAEEAAFLKVISRWVDTSYYWPERRRVHLLAVQSAKENTAHPAKSANLGALKAAAQALPAAGAAALPDMSTNNV